MGRQREGELFIVPKFVQGEEIAPYRGFCRCTRLGRREAEIVGTTGNYLGLSIAAHSGHYLDGVSVEETEKALKAGTVAFLKYGIAFP